MITKILLRLAAWIGDVNYDLEQKRPFHSKRLSNSQTGSPLDADGKPFVFISSYKKYDISLASLEAKLHHLLTQHLYCYRLMLTSASDGYFFGEAFSKYGEKVNNKWLYFSPFCPLSSAFFFF